MSTIEDIATRVHGSKMFSALYVNMGYFQLVIHENNQPLILIISPFGGCIYKRLLMGICAAPEFYQRTMSELR